MLTYRQSYIVLVYICLAIALISFFMAKKRKKSLLNFAVIFLSSLVLGMIVIEYLKHNGYFFKEEILRWLDIAFPSLKEECRNCVANVAQKLWKVDTLNKVQSFSQEHQIKIILGLLSLNCASDCKEIKPEPSPPISEEKILRWLNDLKNQFDFQISGRCLECAVKSLVKLLKDKDLSNILNKSLEDQMKILQAVLVFNCDNCIGRPCCSKI